MSEHRTLFDVRLADPRERAKIAGQRARGATHGAASSSDVRRFGPMAAGALAAVVGVAAAHLAVPAAPPTHAGALALPHVEAKLECASCHVEGEPDAAAAKACSKCHQGHASRRAGHRRLMAAGQLRCVSCHDVHGADEGVRFEAGGGPVSRYAVGRRLALDGFTLYSDHDVTVPMIPVGRCGACHDLSSPSDAIARCVLASQRSAGGAALNVCFDEHQSWSAVEPARAEGVCSSQHGNDRFAAWEVARDVAAEVTALPVAGDDDAGWWWLAAGAASAFVGGFGYSGVAWWRRRRRPQGRQHTALPIKASEVVRLPQIDTSTCLGCYACVDACPYDVLAIDKYVAVVARPEVCCGLTLCQQVCPNGSLVVTDGEPIGDQPRIGDDLMALDVSGVYLAGDVTGLPLIKNAIVQGQRAVEQLAAALPTHDLPLDVLIVGAGPAGISAALEAKSRGLRYAVIEQGGVAQSIRSFPRGKLVFAQPLELPLAGKLWLQESTKEELLTKWMRIVREEKLVIHEGQRLSRVSRHGVGFEVEAIDGDAEDHHHRAARIVLAIGRRGSPRKLAAPLSAEVESKVHYHLADARSFTGRRVMVVGLGDVAMETAIALARQPGTSVSLSYRGESFKRGKSRNIDELRRLIDSQRVTMWWRSTVAEVRPEQVVLDTPTGRHSVDNDALFVMIGSVPPTALLEAVGVRMGSAQPQNFSGAEASQGDPRGHISEA